MGETQRPRMIRFFPIMWLAGFLTPSWCCIVWYFNTGARQKELLHRHCRGVQRNASEGFAFVILLQPCCALSLLFTYTGYKLLWMLAVQHSVSPPHSLAKPDRNVNCTYICFCSQFTSSLDSASCSLWVWAGWEVKCLADLMKCPFSLPLVCAGLLPEHGSVPTGTGGG